METIQEGTLIHATMRAEDLIPAFMAEIDRIKEHGLHTLYPERWDVRSSSDYVGYLDSELGAIERRIERSGYWDSDDAMYDLEWLFDTLDNLAPEGMYFGAHPGDGSDYGFWTVDDTE